MYPRFFPVEPALDGGKGRTKNIFCRMLAIIAVLLVAIPAVAGTWTPNNFIYKPSLGARGEGEKKTFDTGLDRIDARLGKEIWVGDPGSGTTLQDAVTAIGSNKVFFSPSGKGVCSCQPRAVIRLTSHTKLQSNDN